MAVARIEPVRVRRFNPAGLRGKPVERRVRVPRHALVVGAILTGGLVQHVLATTPAEPQPTPLAVVAAAAGPPGSQALRSVTRAHGRASALWPSPRRHPSARPAPVVARRAIRPVAASPARMVTARPPKPGRALATARLARPAHTSRLLPPVGAAGDALRMALAPNPQAAIRHVPSVSVAAIRSALEAARSPALHASYADGKDVAEYIWDAGRVLDVDPAAVVALFWHESKFGTLGMARLTNSVGNIRPLPGQPAVGGYRRYHSWEAGIDDCYRLLLSYARHGAATIPVAIPVWAPPADHNDDGSYIASVLGTMGALYAQSARP
ncbi:MAG TPA: hypothetical protein VKF37_06010 [Chloroflexota bacterium]|nr:hypothetical protein [Chloroflexota bacterium]